VRTQDRECVDEILALGKTDEGKKKLKFAKRTLRVQRCRAVGASASASSTANPSDKSGASAKSKSSYTGAPPVRGDPTLGARLAHLDKDARKAAKKADPGREQRRAEKKKAGTRMRVANDKVRAVSGAGQGGSGKRMGGAPRDGKGKGAGNLKGKGQDRERERKARVHNHKSTAGKGRK
jgi:nucleolar protein 12